MIAALLCFMLRPEPGNLMVDELHAHVRVMKDDLVNDGVMYAGMMFGGVCQCSVR